MNDAGAVHVVGGGLAGLIAAHTVVRAGVACVIHDSTHELGGRGRTDEYRGFRYNRGPHAFYLGGEAARILGTLGVRPRGEAPKVAGTVAVRDGRVALAPVSVASLLRTPLLGWRGKRDLGVLLARIGRIDPATLATTTTAEWIASCTDDEAAGDVLHALVRLTSYVNAPDQLSAEVAVRQIQLGLDPGVMYLHGGWQQLVDALLDPAIRVVTGAPVADLPDAPAVIVATGDPASTARILGRPAPDAVRADAAVLDLGLARRPARRVVLGLDQPIYLSDHGFPEGMTPADRSSVSLAQYLAPGDEPARDLLRVFAAHAGIGAADVIDERYLHRMTVVSSIATAEAGGLRGRSPGTFDGLPGVFAAGDWVGQRGHLLDAVASSAHEAALAAVRHVEARSILR